MPDSTPVAKIGFPYPGLRPFSDEEAGIFFGREEQVDHMLTRLETHHFMAVVGTSGCGKSSLVRAGLIPALEQGLLCGAYPNWRIAVMRPGDAPFECLATALLESKALRERGDDPRATAFLQATLRRGPLGLWEAIQETHLPAETNVLLVVDQFEEIFRYRQQTDNVNDADAFVNLLVASARPPAGNQTQQNPPLFIIITMRSDFIGDCALFIGLPELVSETDFLTPKMTRAQYQDAIVEPARVFGWDLEPSLVNRLLNDLGDSPDQLPVLQHALMRMWTWANADLTRTEKILTVDDYKAVGRLAKALSWHADEALKELTEPQQDLAQTLFRCLSERGASKRDTRRPVKLKQVADVASVNINALRPVVEAFRRADRSFIMPPVPVPLTGDTVLDISHESLIKGWPRLNQWAKQEARSAVIYSRLIESAELYRQGGTELWHGRDLDRALEWRGEENPNAAWARRYGGDFEQAVNFLNYSVEARKKNRRKAQFQRWIFYLLPLNLGVLLVFAWLSHFAWQQRNEAQQAAASARIANLALQSNNARDTSPDLSLALALEAMRLSDGPNIGYNERSTAEQALRWALATAGSQPMSGHDSPVSRLAASPDGRWLASVSWDRSVRLWDLRANPPAQCRVLKGHRNGVAGVAFSPDSRWLATAGRDGVAGLWELERPCNPANSETEPQERLEVPTRNFSEAFTAIAFSSAEGGRLLAVGSDKGVIRLWDITNHTGPQVLEKKHEDGITALEFSPDGRLLASASQDKTVRIWDVAKDSVNWRPPDFTEHHNRVTALAFSPDGHWLASADADGAIYRWDPINVSVKNISLKGHEDAVVAIAFKQDGRTLISASRDGTIRLWDAAAEPEPAPQLKPRIFLRQDSLSAMTLAKDDHRLISASTRERIIRLWELNKPTTIEPLQLWDHERSVVAVAFSPTPAGLHLVSADRDGSARSWNLTEPFPIGFGGAESQDRNPGAEPQGGASGSPEKAFRTRAVNPAISPDGRTLATAGENADKDYIIRLWNLTDSTVQPRSLPGQARITALAFSPEGHTLAAADKNRKVFLWNLDEPTAAPRVLSGYETPATALAFSPEGHTLASADESGKVFLWNLSDSNAKPRSFTLHAEAITALAFSPNGRMLASASRDKTMRLWNRDDGREVRTFTGYEGIAMVIAFSPDGRTLASSSADNTIWLWDLAHPELDARILRGHQGTLFALAFSPDGRFLASGAADRAVFVWRTQVKELSELACSYNRSNLSAEEWKKYFKDDKYHETCPKGRH